MKSQKFQIGIYALILFSFTNCQHSTNQLEFQDPAVGYEYEKLSQGMTVPNFLVGQWISPSQDILYFSPTDENGHGMYVLEQAQHTENSKIIPLRRFVHLYNIFQLSEDGKMIDVIYLFDSGQKRLSRYILSENGKYMTNLSLIGRLEIVTVLKKVNNDYIPK